MASPLIWNEWSRHVLSELERLNTGQEKLGEQLNEVRVEIAKLKVKSGVWGLIAGSIPVAVAAGWMIIREIGG